MLASKTNAPSQALEKDRDGTWQVYGYEEAKILMRGSVTQAGFNTEKMRDSPFIPSPIPAIDGDEHRERRSGIGKFFTPSTVNKQYRAMIEQFTDRAIAQMPRGETFDFKDYTTQVASDVVCEILGLKHSTKAGLPDRFLHVAENPDVGSLALSIDEMRRTLWSAKMLLNFWRWDVQPAIKANRNNPQHNLISHMIAKAYSPFSILIECITYAFAGMTTTREYMCSVLELCCQNSDYKHIMLSDNQEARTRLLYEILRLNPVTSHLTRRAVEDITVESDGISYQIAQGELIVFNILEIDTDSRALGDDAHELNPQRDFRSRIMWSMFAFGDGNHRCPGEALAILETDLLLQKLLQHNIEVISYPSRSHNDPTKTNELYDFRIRLSDA
ncbi:MAG: cytochrome P450 [Chloroflexota bacterium]